METEVQAEAEAEAEAAAAAATVVVAQAAKSDGTLSLCKAATKVIKLAVPTAVSYCATTLSNTAAFAFIGRHTNELAQASHALGYSIGNILVLMIGLGLINGMDSLCPLAIGQGHPEDTFDHLIQAFFIVTVSMVPLVPLIACSEKLLILCKQDVNVAKGASQYLITSFPALFFICIFEAIRKFLIYHRKVCLQSIISLMSIPIQILFLWILVAKYKLQTIGAGIARSVTWMTLSVVLMVLTFIRREDFAWSKYIRVNLKKGMTNNRNDSSRGSSKNRLLQQQTHDNSRSNELLPNVPFESAVADREDEQHRIATISTASTVDSRKAQLANNFCTEKDAAAVSAAADTNQIEQTKIITGLQGSNKCLLLTQRHEAGAPIQVCWLGDDDIETDFQQASSKSSPKRSNSNGSNSSRNNNGNSNRSRNSNGNSHRSRNSNGNSDRSRNSNRNSNRNSVTLIRWTPDAAVAAEIVGEKEDDRDDDDDDDDVNVDNLAIAIEFEGKLSNDDDIDVNSSVATIAIQQEQQQQLSQQVPQFELVQQFEQVQQYEQVQQFEQVEQCDQVEQLVKMEYHDEHWWLGLGRFLSIAIPATFLCIFEWLSFEVQVFEAGYLGPTQLAALSASQSLGSLLYFFSLSVGVTVNSEVGREIGQFRSINAKIVTKTGMIVSVLMSVPVATIVCLCRNPIARIFSSSDSIRKPLSKNLLILGAGVVFADSLHAIIGGSIKALSLQWLASVFDAIGMLGIMQCIGVLVSFRTPMKSQGFVLATAIGVYLVDICYVVILFCCVDWRKQANHLAARRLKRSGVKSLIVRPSDADCPSTQTDIE